MDDKNGYDGFKADIFCLASSLIILTTGCSAFQMPIKNDTAFSKILDGDYDQFWQIFDQKLLSIGMTLSKEFKNLFNKMISCKPDERPSIKEILKDPWFQEIKDMKKNDKKKLEELEDEIKAIFSSKMSKNVLNWN